MNSKTKGKMVEIIGNKVLGLRRNIITAFDSKDYEKIGSEYPSYSNNFEILILHSKSIGEEYEIEELLKAKIMDLIDLGIIEKEIQSVMESEEKNINENNIKLAIGVFERIGRFKKLNLSFIEDKLEDKEKELTEKLTELVMNQCKKSTEINPQLRQSQR